MSDYTFDAVWPSPSDDVRNEVVDFWLQEIALPQGKAVERSQQLLIVCRDAAGAVAAVSTAVPSFVANLGLRCFYLRAFVGRAHRAQGLRGTGVIHRLLRESYNVLNARFQQGIDPHVVGLYLEVENSSARRHRNELVWTDLGANIVFVGPCRAANMPDCGTSTTRRFPETGKRSRLPIHGPIRETEARMGGFLAGAGTTGP